LQAVPHIEPEKEKYNEKKEKGREIIKEGMTERLKVSKKGISRV
jgi:hypothetical protein